MRRAALGVFSVAMSIAIPATFGGTVFLTGLWAVIAACGMGLIITSEPVKRRWISYLRSELAFGEKPLGSAELREAAGWLLANFERARETLESSLEGGYWWDPDRNRSLLSGWTDRAATILVQGYADEHRDIRAAVRLTDQVYARCKGVWEDAEAVEPWPDDEPQPIHVPDPDKSDRKLLEGAIAAAKVAEADLERVLR